MAALGEAHHNRNCSEVANAAAYWHRVIFVLLPKLQLCSNVMLRHQKSSEKIKARNTALLSIVILLSVTPQVRLVVGRPYSRLREAGVYE